jgi:glutamate synthase domain-containing protein 2
VTAEIASIRGVPQGKDVLSPPYHKAFQTPLGLLQFVARVRESAGGIPVGVKICIGQRSQFLSVCKQMKSSGILPDFIAVDGGEGGTGAAPLEFSNRIGSPLVEGLRFVDNALRGFELRRDIKIMASSRILTGFDVIKALALGADLVYSARGMMLALGCIQALKCNSNHCPTGVASQDPKLYGGLVVGDKSARVANYHAQTMESVVEMLGAMGIKHPDDLRPHHIRKRISEHETRTYAELYPGLQKGDLLGSAIPHDYKTSLELAGDGSRF